MQSRVHAIPVPLRARVLLGQPLPHSAVFIGKNQAAVVGVAVRMRKQRRQAALLPVPGHEAAEVYIKNGVCVEQQEILRQLVLQAKERSCVAQRLRLHEVFDLYPEWLPRRRRNAAAIAEVVHDDVSKVADGEDDVRESLLPQAFQLMLQHRLTLDGNHRLGNVPRH